MGYAVVALNGERIKSLLLVCVGHALVDLGGLRVKSLHLVLCEPCSCRSKCRERQIFVPCSGSVDLKGEWVKSKWREG